jgi:hypothetical protein
MIISPEMTLTLACSSLEEKTEWMIAITNLLAKYLQIQSTRGVDSAHRPQDKGALKSVSIVGTELRKEKTKKSFTVRSVVYGANSTIDSCNRRHTHTHMHTWT